MTLIMIDIRFIRVICCFVIAIRAVTPRLPSPLLRSGDRKLWSEWLWVRLALWWSLVVGVSFRLPFYKQWEHSP